MSSERRDDDNDVADPGPPLSRDAVTPRGGFMARPGLKAAPRHAVVVRLGDAPESEEIPLARSSVAPAAPNETAESEAGPVSASEKITLRAIPTPSAAPPTVRHDAASSDAPVSRAPLSDAPLAASVWPPHSSGPSSRRLRAGSSWTIAAAAALGLLFGLASIAARARHTATPATPAAQPPTAAPLAASSGVPELPLPPAELALPAPSSPAAPSSSASEAVAVPRASPRDRHRSHAPSHPSGAKQNIF